MGRDARELDEVRRELSRERHTVRGVLGILADAGDVRCDDAEAGVRVLVAQRDEARAEVERHRADLTAAAGECLVPLPEPGSDLARLLRANRLLRAELAERHRIWNEAKTLYAERRRLTDEWKAEVERLRGLLERWQRWVGVQRRSPHLIEQLEHDTRTALEKNDGK